MSKRHVAVGALRDRWSFPEGAIVLDSLNAAFSGKLDSSSMPAFGAIDGRVDLRGLSLPNAMLTDVTLNRMDLSHSRLGGLKLRGGRLEDVVFNGTDFSGFSDHANRYVGVIFRRADFRGAAIGFEGSEFRRCRFEDCNFGKTVFGRAEFEDCVFSNCRLKAVDFNVSSFVRCKFVGKLEDLWFRGAYPFDGDVKRFGSFKKNEMLDVDFSEAELSWITYTGGVPLGTVILPNDPYVFYMDRLSEVLPVACARCNDLFAGEDLAAAKVFFSVQFKYIPEQSEQIFTLRDYLDRGVSQSFLENLKCLLHSVRADL